MQPNAWQLTLTNRLSLAIAQPQVVEYLSHVDAVAIPDCHERCAQVVIWRGHVLPVLGATHHQLHHEHLLVVAYVTRNGGTSRAERIALSLLRAPEALVVTDEQQCEPDTEQLAYWGDAIQSCVLKDGEPVAIVDFAALTGEPEEWQKEVRKVV